MQAHCPIYMVNVSSMSAGDMIAAAKMQGNTHTHVYLYTHKQAHTHAYTHPHTHTHAHTHPRTHKHAHTHTHLQTMLT